MDQQKIGQFLKQLRKEKHLTQEQFAEMLGVSNRTVSRWETGTNMPDFDVLIEIADFYKIDIKEILEGKREKDMDTNGKENLLLIADYTNQEKHNLSKGMRGLFVVGLLAMVIYLILNSVGEFVFVCHFLLGGVTGILLMGVLFTTKYMTKIREFKLRLLNSKKERARDDEK
ncbi:MAG: helix-turn-helix transcriptional regulator [Clostridia bacterium]|nr:helix-turn-helix transcriptional regulator [Clostridia bacterium]